VARGTFVELLEVLPLRVPGEGLVGLAVLAALDDDDLVLAVLATLLHYMQKLYFRKDKPKGVRGMSVEGEARGGWDGEGRIGTFMDGTVANNGDGGSVNTYYKCLSWLIAHMSRYKLT
jgi:hypothetical protein